MVEHGYLTFGINNEIRIPNKEIAEYINEVIL